jgi:hypothetical protein
MSAGLLHRFGITILAVIIVGVEGISTVLNFLVMVEMLIILI